MRRFAAPSVAVVAIFLAVSPVAAAGWSPPTAITRTHDAFPSYARSLAVAGGVVHLVDSRLTGQLEYRRSTDGGASWSTPLTLARPDARFTSVLGDPAIAARDSLVVFAYRAHDAEAAYLFIRRSTDGGRTWGRPQQVARIVTDRRIGEQSVAISPAGVFVAWTDRVTGAIDLRRSTDGAAHFGPIQRLGVTTYSFFPGNPAFTDGLIGLAASGSDVYLAWSPSGSGNADSIVLRRSRDGGSTFLPARTVFDLPNFGWPALASAGPYLLGEFTAADGTLWVLRSADHGGTDKVSSLAAPTSMSTVAEGSVAIDGGGTALVSYSRSAIASGSAAPVGDVLVRRSEDGGRHWTEPAKASRNVPGIGNVATALTGSGALLVFATCQDGAFTVCDVAAVRSTDRH